MLKSSAEQLASRDTPSASVPRARPVVALRILLSGRVQGLGVRPAIARLAQELRLAGSVSNSTDGVVIHIEGPRAALDSFRRRLPDCLPPGARAQAIATRAAAPLGHAEFRIEPSTSAGPLAAQVPSDVAVCEQCRADMSSTSNRRHGYAFTTCTRCGPRYSLIYSMPYDRPATAMAGFTPCARCREEYLRTVDRRFHSQTNGCAQCGPRLWLSEPGGRMPAAGENALATALDVLRSGRVLAMRGVGGYQLVVDASSDLAVAELRRRKGRFGKPLAVMVADLAAAERLAAIDPTEKVALAGPANPIVVLPMRSRSPLAAGVSEGVNTIGLMLPATPLHVQLAEHFSGPLVVTSGNFEGDPLVFEGDSGPRELSSLADAWLDHDRPIVRPIDDSVVRIIAGRAATVRMARGLAPLPLALESRLQILALGGHQKAAIALCNGAQAALGPYVGDLETQTVRARYLEHIEATCRLYGVVPKLLVHDQHPDYFTSRWAGEQNIPTMAVQHHHAHVAAGMLEHGWLDREVLGIAWDGTGHGPDGTIWGGEFLVATAKSFRRVARLRPFALPGGDLAVRQPWRVAVALVHQAIGGEAAAGLRFAGVDPRQIRQLAVLLDKPRLWLETSSAGRLFDGVAALVLGATHSQFEGQPAMWLEAACEETAGGEYPLPYSPGEPAELDWRPLIRGVLSDRAAGHAPGAIAIRFHRALAAGIAAVAQRWPELPVVLCGGCFINRVLTERVVEQLARRGRPVGAAGTIPTGDGGLAAGQLAVAAARTAGGGPSCA